MADSRSIPITGVEESPQEVHDIRPSMLKTNKKPRKKRGNPQRDPVYRGRPVNHPARTEEQCLEYDFDGSRIIVNIYVDELNKPSIINKRIAAGIKALHLESDYYSRCDYQLIIKNDESLLLATYELYHFKIIDGASIEEDYRKRYVSKFLRHLNLYKISLGEYIIEKDRIKATDIYVIDDGKSQVNLAEITKPNDVNKGDYTLKISDPSKYPLEKSAPLCQSLIKKAHSKTEAKPKKMIVEVNGQKKLAHNIGKRKTHLYIHGSATDPQRKEEAALARQLKLYNEKLSSKSIKEADGVSVRSVATHNDPQAVKFQYATQPSATNNNAMEAPLVVKKIWKECAEVSMNGDAADQATVTDVEKVMLFIPTKTLEQVEKMKLEEKSEETAISSIGSYTKDTSGDNLGTLVLAENIAKETAYNQYPNLFKRFKRAVSTPVSPEVIRNDDDDQDSSPPSPKPLATSTYKNHDTGEERSVNAYNSNEQQILEKYLQKAQEEIDALRNQQQNSSSQPGPRSNGS